MSAVWISKESWDKVWNALHNIQIRQSFAVKSPGATLSGNGTSACLNIDLPGTAQIEETKSVYNGYFKIIDATEEAEVPDTEGEGTHTETLFKVKVADGATYDEEKGTSTPGLCHVDNALFNVNLWTSDIICAEVSADSPLQEKMIVLKYTPYLPETPGEGTEGEDGYIPPIPESPAGITVEMLDEIPVHPNKIIYYPLGRILLTYDAETETTFMTLQQDHTSGAVFMEAYYSGMFACDFEYVEEDGEAKFYVTVSEGTFSVASKNFFLTSFRAEFTGAGAICLVYNPNGYKSNDSESDELVYARVEYRTTPPASNYIQIGNAGKATTGEGVVFPVITQQQKDDFFILTAMDIYNGAFAVYPTDSGVIVKAGDTDIGNTADTEFGGEACGKAIYLIGLSDGETYSVQLYCGETVPEGTYKSFPVQIATVDSSGVPHQVWKNGNIRFADLYLL